jgi:hypothetical protein
MKLLNLSALSQVNLGEISDFLKWLDHAPSGQLTVRQVKVNPPIRSSKLGAALKALEQFEFILADESHVTLTDAGREFSRSNLTVKMETLRKQFLNYGQVQMVLESLEASKAGRLKARVVYYSFKEAYENLTEGEFRGFVDWAHWSELFHYDKKRDEVYFTPFLFDRVVALA